MKNKKLIWILLPVVLVIWGLIFFQVKKAVQGGNNATVAPAPIPMAFTNASDTVIYQLKLNYDDPFLKGGRKVIVQAPSSDKPKTPTLKKPKVVRTVTKLPLKWPNIIYRGLISSKKGNKSIYMLEVDGASILMTAGEQRDYLRLIKVYKDSVRIEYKGEEKRTFTKP